MTGYKDETGKIRHEIGVYYVSKNNLGAGQKIGDFTDFSFLAPKNFDGFIETVKNPSTFTRRTRQTKRATRKRN